ncbi:MAG: TetR/AcrR family transcriptional regulator [Nocardioidaceae bacterium]
MTRRDGRAAPMAPDERRAAILDAVIPMLLEHGPEMTTREIADAAGVAEGTLFRVFEDKPSLLMAACWRIMRPENVTRWLGGIYRDAPLEVKIREIVTTMADGVERVMAVLMAVRTLAHGDPAHVPSRPHGEGGEDPRAFMAESNRVMLETLTDLFRPDADLLRVSPERAAVLTRGLVYGTHQPGMDAEQRPSVDELVDVLLAGLTRDGARAAAGHSSAHSSTDQNGETTC